MPITLWAARLTRDLTEREYEGMLRMLPPARRERLVRQKVREKQQETLCAYLLLCMALRQTYGWKQLPEIALSAHGKPGFIAYPEVQFNISHTTGAVLVGLSDQPLGVDIERVRPVSARAMERLAHVSTPEAFFQSWVRREARAKRTGTGVGTMMRSETPLGRGEFYYELDTFPGYVAGAATRSTDVPEKVKTYVLGESGLE